MSPSTRPAGCLVAAAEAQGMGPGREREGAREGLLRSAVEREERLRDTRSRVLGAESEGVGRGLIQQHVAIGSFDPVRAGRRAVKAWIFAR